MNRYGNRKENERASDFTIERQSDLAKGKNITQEQDLTGIQGIKGIERVGIGVITPVA
jgi:hypothetical protein